MLRVVRQLALGSGAAVMCALVVPAATMAASAAAPTGVVVQATQDLPGTDAGLQLTTGEQISISATGTASYCPGCVTGPDGDPNHYDGSAVLPSAPVGALLGKIVSSSGSIGWLLIGSHDDMTAPYSGELFLIYNDVPGEYSNNGGSYTVTFGHRCTSTTSGLPAPVVVRALEVSQVVQDWCDSMPLIAGKPTLVRVHLQTIDGSGGHNERVYLAVSQDGNQLPTLHPVSPGAPYGGDVNPIFASSDPETVRGNVSSTANFFLPASYLHGTVTFTATPGAGSSFGCADPTSVPSACSATVTFEPSPTFHVVLVQAGYPKPDAKGFGPFHLGRRCVYPNSADLNDEVTRLMEVMPVAPDHFDWQVDWSHNDDNCLDAPGSTLSDGSWSESDFLGPAIILSNASAQSDGAAAATAYIAVLKSTPSAWQGTSGGSQPSIHGNVVWYSGHDLPYQDPYTMSRYEIAHELLHAMGLLHPGSWLDDQGQPHSVNSSGLCGEGGTLDTTPRPTVAVDRSSWSPYTFAPGIASKYPFDFGSFTTGLEGYPTGRAYAIGPMADGANREIYGVNTDAFYWGDLPGRIVVDPHHTFDLMSYCYGTYPRVGASKFQWVTDSEYTDVLNLLQRQ